jgi:TPR repeat
MKGHALHTRLRNAGMVLLVFLCPLLLNKLSAQPVNEWIQSGNQSFKSGEFTKAIDQYNQALQKDSLSAIALYNRSVAGFKMKEEPAAQQDWLKLLKNENKTVQQHSSYNLGVSYSKSYEMAKEAEEKGYVSVDLKTNSKEKTRKADMVTVKLGPNASKEMMAAGKAYLLDQSIEAYKQALRLNPEDQQARENLQKALLEQKRNQSPKKKEQDNKKPKPEPQQQNQQQRSKMNQREAERQLKLLQQKEKEVKEKMQQKQSKGGGQPKDW